MIDGAAGRLLLRDLTRGCDCVESGDVTSSRTLFPLFSLGKDDDVDSGRVVYPGLAPLSALESQTLLEPPAGMQRVVLNLERERKERKGKVGVCSSYLVVVRSMMMRAILEPNNHADQTNSSVQTNRSKRTKGGTIVYTALELEWCAMEKETNVADAAMRLYTYLGLVVKLGLRDSHNACKQRSVPW